MTTAAVVARPGWDRWRDALDRYGWMVIALVGAYYAGVQVYQHGFAMDEWDFMRVSAWLWLALGFELAQQAPRRMREMVGRLQRRGALEATDDEVGQVLADIDARSARWGAVCGILSALILLGAHLVRPALNLFDYFLVVLGAFGGGFHLGRGASYGRIGWLLRQQGCMLRMVPGHIDGVGGLKPVGEFDFFQAKSPPSPPST